MHPDAAALLPDAVEPILRPESHGLRRALRGLAGFGPSDLIHGLDVDLPVRPGAATVATVHDLAVFDVPEGFPRRRAAGERLLVGRLHPSSRRGAWPSPHSPPSGWVLSSGVGHRRPLGTRDGHDAGLGRRSDFGPYPLLAYPDQFCLHVGNIEPRKDLSTLAAACRSVDLPLVLTGHPLWGHAPPVGAMAIGHVPEGDLPALYGAATVVGYASRYEGFGLPPIEAMACGAAVVTTPVPAVVEVVGEGAATFRPGDVDDLVRTLRELVADPARRTRAGPIVAPTPSSTLSWARTAEQTADVYRSVGVAV